MGISVFNQNFVTFNDKMQFSLASEQVAVKLGSETIASEARLNESQL